MMNNSSSEQSRMLKDISIIDFTLVELNEYLDTHPHDRQAMEYFNHYARIKNQMARDFSARYFPLTADMSTDTREWNWVLSPMPWESSFGEGGCK
ncbi:MAG: spore coat protein CotJB [Lachnospiraceae bacterium]|nr:spore coat protein CotJB [Lachnospiraceae bacterium]MBD5498110.1 spore coat protein CotJB [Lachnospiraceae bacterium]MBD5512935.1 spore coat protein CotJB [Lachnospiraceae bacterium]